MITENLKVNLSIKTLIAVIIWVISVVGVWFALTNKVNNLEVEVGELKSNLKQHNLEVLEYKINHVSEQLDKILNALK